MTCTVLSRRYGVIMSKHGKYAVPGERDERPTPQRGRKDRRRWCKGKEGVEHVPEIVLSHHARWRQDYYKKPVVCLWRERHRWETTADSRVWTGTDEWTWDCVHEERCENCGKILVAYRLGERCPDYRPRTA